MTHCLNNNTQASIISTIVTDHCEILPTSSVESSSAHPFDTLLSWTRLNIASTVASQTRQSDLKRSVLIDRPQSYPRQSHWLPSCAV